MKVLLLLLIAVPAFAQSDITKRVTGCHYVYDLKLPSGFTHPTARAQIYVDDVAVGSRIATKWQGVTKIFSPGKHTIKILWSKTTNTTTQWEDAGRIDCDGYSVRSLISTDVEVTRRALNTYPNVGAVGELHSLLNIVQYAASQFDAATQSFLDGTAERPDLMLKDLSLQYGMFLDAFNLFVNPPKPPTSGGTPIAPVISAPDPKLPPLKAAVAKLGARIVLAGEYRR